MTDRKPIVYYDGSCPMCRREIGYYQKQTGSDAIQWTDVSSDPPTEALGPDLEQDAAMARFHMRQADGTLVSGAAGFAMMWQQLPRFAWAGRIAAFPGVRHLLEVGYRVLLPVRPFLQRFVVKWFGN